MAIKKKKKKSSFPQSRASHGHFDAAVLLMLCSVSDRGPQLFSFFLPPVRFVTLAPGDVFLTGTPPGVGFFRKPPIFLKVISWIKLT